MRMRRCRPRQVRSPRAAITPATGAARPAVIQARSASAVPGERAARATGSATSAKLAISRPASAKPRRANTGTSTAAG